VLVAEALRSLLWRVNGAVALLWPVMSNGAVSTTNRTIKLLGAIGVLWGARSLTVESGGPGLRVVTRVLATVALGANAARVVLALAGALDPWSESAALLLDGLTITACALCVASKFDSGGSRGSARGARAFAVVYFVVAGVGAMLSALPRNDHGMRAGVSLAMLALGGWGIAMVVRLRGQQ
jgi:hypothetical protein